MSLDKRQKKGILRGLVVFLIVIVLIILIGFLFTFRADAIRLTVRGFYKNGETDVVFLGNSHALCGIDVDLYNYLTGSNTYVLSTNAQSISNSAYLAEEAIRKEDVELIYVEVFSLIFEKENFSALASINNPVIKIKSFFSKEDTLSTIQSFLPLIRYHSRWKKPKSWNKYAINKKIAIEKFERYNSSYYKGSLLKDTMLTDERLEEYSTFAYSFDAENLLNIRKDNIEKIMRLCENNDVKVIFFLSPWLERFIDNSNYDEVKKLLDSYFESQNAEYYDLNSIDIGIEDSDFLDEHVSMSQHLNLYGAAKLTKYLADVYNLNAK